MFLKHPPALSTDTARYSFIAYSTYKIDNPRKNRGVTEEQIGGYARNKRGGDRGTNRGVTEEHTRPKKPDRMRLFRLARNSKLIKTVQDCLKGHCRPLDAAATLYYYVPVKKNP